MSKIEGRRVEIYRVAW